MLNIEKNIDEGRDLVESLLLCPPVRFTSRSVDVPSESGVYALFESAHCDIGNVLYVGESHKSERGLRGRMEAHWDGNARSDLACELAKEGEGDLGNAKKWIKENVVIRYIVKRDFDMDIKTAEHFIISVLRPKFNKQ